MSLQALIEKFKQAREAATQGEWKEITPTFERVNGMNAAIVMLNTDADEDGFSVVDEKFCILSANEILKLIEACEIMQDALCNNCQCYGNYVCDHHEALEKADEICKGVPA